MPQEIINNSVQPHQETSSAWHRELNLIEHLPEDIGAGFLKRVDQANHDKAATAIEFGAAIAVGAALAYTTKNPGMLSRGTEAVLGMGAALNLLGTGLAVAEPFKMAWESDKGLAAGRKYQSEFLGGSLFDLPLMVAGGAVGMKGMSWASRTEFSTLSYLKAAPVNALATTFPTAVALASYESLNQKH